MFVFLDLLMGGSGIIRIVQSGKLGKSDLSSRNGLTSPKGVLKVMGDFIVAIHIFLFILIVNKLIQ